ncbi:MAG: tyrosine-protein phosphatase [Pseudomonadota bacterium]
MADRDESLTAGGPAATPPVSRPARKKKRRAPADPKTEQRRRRRERRWLKPLDTPRKRLKAWANMLLVDHGIFRALYSNTHRVTALMWRSAQPMPHHIRRFARAGGATVVSLRGGTQFGSLPLELEACDTEGLEFETIVLRSRGLPKRDELLETLDRLETLETPVLFHCKSGADRAGFMSGLWLMHIEGADVATAQAQLSLAYGHFRRSKTGILDAFFEAYAADQSQAATGDGAHQQLSLREWVATRYDPAAIRAAFRPAGLASLIGDGILRRE